MYVPGYTPKHAMQDMLKMIGYRVNHPNAAPTQKLLDAESRLRNLSGTEMLDVVVRTLSCGFRPGIDPPETAVPDDGIAAKAFGFRRRQG